MYITFDDILQYNVVHWQPLLAWEGGGVMLMLSLIFNSIIL